MYFAGLADFNEQSGHPRRKFNRSTLVFVSSCILAICSIIASAVAASLLPGNQTEYNAGVGVSQGLTLAVSCMSFLYLGFYLVAARKNEEVGRTRPPVRKLHAACFISIRIAAILWFGVVIASLVISFKKEICSKSSLLCRLEKLDAVISITAFLSSAMILWCLETSSHPFKTPKSLPIRSKPTYRTSLLDDLLDRSVSRACNRESCKRDYEKQYTRLGAFEKEYTTTILTAHPSLRKKPSSAALRFPVTNEAIQKVPGAFPTDSSKRSSDSSLSTWSGTSDFSGYSGTTYINPQRPRRARPTSSITSSTKRSPLSTMRYADFPNIAIKPDLRYAPPPNIPVPPIPPAHQWNLYQPQPQYQRHIIYHNLPLPPPGYIGPAPLLPVANPPYNNSQYLFNRQPSAMVRPLNIKKVSDDVKISPTTPPKLSRKNTVDVKVPGAFKVELDIGDENKDESEDGENYRVSRAFSVKEGEEIPPIFGRKIERFFDRGRGVGSMELGVEGSNDGKDKNDASGDGVEERFWEV